MKCTFLLNKILREFCEAASFIKWKFVKGPILLIEFLAPEAGRNSTLPSLNKKNIFPREEKSPSGLHRKKKAAALFVFKNSTNFTQTRKAKMCEF